MNVPPLDYTLRRDTGGTGPTPANSPRMRRVFIAAMCFVVVIPIAGYARPVEPVALIDRGAPDCTQIPPEETPALALSTSDQLTLRVRFVFERGDRKLAKTYVATTVSAFERIGVALEPSFERIPVPEDWENSPLSSEPSREEQFELVKKHYGGRRPDGTDAVYYFSRYWAGGFADCIGGIRWPDRAFAIGSTDYATEGIVPAPTVNEGVIAAHELGHLLGAHHHYSNCVEAAPKGTLAGEPGACTTMSPLAITASTTFSLMEASFIRHYVQEYGTAHNPR